jgi:Skp family chaperone for outer membrane proteins
MAMKTLARVLVVVATTLAPGSTLAQSVKVQNRAELSPVVRLACFSPQRVFAESVDGRAAIARFSALEDQKARAIEEKNKALLAQEEALQQSAQLLNEAARAQRSSDVEKFRIDVQRFIQDAQAELMGVQRELQSAFLVKLKPAVDKVARDKSLQMVFSLDEGPIAWFDPSLDITSDVVRQLAQK